MNFGKAGEAPLLLLLVRAAARFRDDLDAVIDEDPDAPDILRRLHGGQRRLLTMVPPAGARGTDLATRLGITKQALGEFAAALAEAGLLRADVDPTDARARLWRLTPEGERAAAAGRRAVSAVESDWRIMLGGRDYARLVTALERLHTERRSAADSSK